MDRSELRAAIAENKAFLRDLYNSDSDKASTLLKLCSSQELKVLFYVCSFISRGEIPLFKRSARSIGHSQLETLKQFESKTFSPDVRSQLLQLTSSLHELLRPLFEAPT